MEFAAQPEESKDLNKVIKELKQMDAYPAIEHIEKLAIKNKKLNKISLEGGRDDLRLILAWEENDHNNRYNLTSYLSIDQPGGKPDKIPICDKCKRPL